MKRRTALNNSIRFSLFTSSLASLLDTGFTPFAALSAYTESNDADDEFLDVLREVTESMQKGEPIGKSFVDTEYFPEDFCSIVESGERSGTLSSCLREYGQYLNTFQSAQRSFRSALTYPLVMMSALVIAVFVFGGFLIPKTLLPLLAARKLSMTDLGLPGMILQVISLVSFGGQFVTIILMLATIYWMWIPGRKKIESLFLGIPAMKRLFNRLSWSVYMKVLSMCMRSGMRMTESVNASESSAPPELEGEDVEKRLQSGDSLAEIWQDAGVDRLICLLVRTGTRGGELPEMLENTAHQYMAGMEQEIKQASSAIEPIVIGLLAGVGGTIVSSLMMAIFKLSTKMS